MTSSTQPPSLRQCETLEEFMARGLASLENAKDLNDFVDADEVVEKLRQRLIKAKEQLQRKREDAMRAAPQALSDNCPVTS